MRGMVLYLCVSMTVMRMIDSVAELTECELMHEEADVERALIDQARHDPEAFGRLYRMHYACIAGYLLRRTGNEHVAEDLAGETFVAALGAIGRFRHTGAPFGAWLMRIATNQVNRWAKKTRRDSDAKLWIAKHADGSFDECEADHAEMIRQALDSLSVDHQTVLYLHHVEGMKVEQVALVLGVSQGTVKSRLHRARAALLVICDRIGVV